MTYQVIIIGAGILGLASAYHLLNQARGLSLLVIDRFCGPGLGNTARSAAAFRDMFSSPLNRDLSRGSIAFYEQIQKQGTRLGLRKIGYLWLLTAQQAQASRGVLDSLAAAAIEFDLLEVGRLRPLLPELRAGDISLGLLGSNCGILNPNLLCRYYEQRVRELGGKFFYGAEVSGFTLDHDGRITGVDAGGNFFEADTVVVAAGAWMNATLALAGLGGQVVPRKRQLFAVAAKAGALHGLIHSRGFNADGLLPFTILPGGAYLRPATGFFILGYANEDQPPGLEDHPLADADFFEKRLRPQVERYFPAFQGLTPEYSWAGHYADHPPDNLPLVDRVGGAIVVGGDSGSGIMKADSLGRIAAGLYLGREQVELGQGRPFRVKDLALTGRRLAPEALII
jgi:glycine/D-amino acid oxidase-like deaminating enzyme